MLVNAIEGFVENGLIRLRENVSLPENARVYVIVTDMPDDRSARIRSPRLTHMEQSKDFRKQVVEFAPDAKL